MTQSQQLRSRIGLATLVVAPLWVMGILSVSVLLPGLKNPESNIYGSSIGYPALKRLVRQPIKVQTVPVSQKNIEENVAAPGESVPLQQVAVKSLVSGTVEQVYVVEGQQVRRGQRLLQLDRKPFEDSVSSAQNNLITAENTLRASIDSTEQQLIELKDNVKSEQAKLALSEAKFKQAKVLLEAGAIGQFQLYEYETDIVNKKNNLVTAQQELARTETDKNKELKNNRLAVENGKIALRQAQRNLKHTVLYASTDGLVSAVSIYSGEVADTRNSILTLTQDVAFKAYIDQARLNTVKIGDVATVRLVAFPGLTYQGRVIRLNPTVQTSTIHSKVGTDRQYTYSAWISIDKLQMSPGLQGYAHFGETKTRLVIPENAVTHLSGGEGMVMVAEGNRAAIKQVRLGKIVDNQREVLAGLKPGEKVVLSPRALNPGDALKIQNPSD